MLYYLFEYLNTLEVPGMGAFTYVTTRAGLAFILSMLIATIVGRRIIDKLQLKQIGETIRDLGLEGQISKKGTPTMGGIIIIIALLIPSLLLCKLSNIYIILMIVTTLWLGVLGFADDYIKVFKKHKEGLRGKYKIIAQIGLGILVAVTLTMSPAVVIKENIQTTTSDGVTLVEYNKLEQKSAQTTIPFVKNNNLDYGKVADLLGLNGHKDLVTFLVLIIVCIFIVTAVSNGSNLTDGLDGLAAGSSAIIGVVLGVLAYMSSHMEFASYLNIMFIPGAEELVVFAAAFIGSIVGFLWYNSYPAQVFMGDTGSLTLGGIIAVYAIVLRKELLLPILCGIFLVESLSVMIQVFYFKYTRKKYGEGRRVFKMTPLHHHFQKPGNAGIDALIQHPVVPVQEAKIVFRMWIVGIILAVLTVITLKLR
ncbi:phospho-N-acetylmuramoyl-pentapeptide-transferase [Porphyromonas cangingivalis]|uniref:phospho-N-acetylmuramoyl-pentapeptide- transferase n=1 Tax=Porphyromonas cangingivalis TaxID=36874 RepID=UPI000D90D569|nr:phospho-N-acetylmuramoyl-pentapeptide-transferase [Porphyromonas cangingivalis]SPY35257.1 Phospho-N-acetylmuramoyl-pentapeptide-transferase [Porphyromonas cangingivalis]